MSVFTFTTKEGKAALALDTVLGILPDANNKKRSLILTSSVADGMISSEDAASKLIEEWSEMLEEQESDLMSLFGEGYEIEFEEEDPIEH